MRFSKMHGIGNDYIYINCFEEKVENPEKVSVYVSDRHKGIGSDGLVLILPSDKADFRMRIFNADGFRGYDVRKRNKMHRKICIRQGHDR